MKVLCAISGIEFNCDYFPATLNSRETTHPIFHLTQKKLIGYISKFSAGELTNTDSYLLFLALLNSTELVDWRVSAVRTPITDSLVASNMEYLTRVVSSINVIKNPALALPQFAVTSDTKTLDNIYHWIESWDDAIQQFTSGYKTTGDWQAIRNREAVLERLIKTPSRNIESYASILANWAEVAAMFPVLDTTYVNGTHILLADYWKQIIRKCCKSESIFEIPKKDIVELIEHCEENLVHGSIYSYELFKLLRSGLDKQSAFLGVDLSTVEFTILDASNGVEDANKLLVIQNAPKERPLESQFVSKTEFIKAKIAYNMASNYKQQLVKSELKRESDLILNLHTSAGEL